MRILAILAISLAALLAMAPAGRTAGEGADELAALLQDLLSGAGRTVRIEGFEGALSAQARAASITVADDEGVWLKLDDVAIDWSQSALMQRSIEISYLRAGRITLDRLPHPTPDARPSPEARPAFVLPELPLGIAIDEVSAASLVLGPEILGRRVEGTMTGRALLRGGEGSGEIDLRRTDGAEGALRLALAYANATGRLDLDLSLEEGAEGIVATLLRVPERPAISLGIAGSGPISDFTADMRLASGGQERITGGIGIGRDATTGDRVLTAALAGDATPLLAQEHRPFFGPDGSLAFRAVLPAAGGIRIETLRADAAQIGLSGQLGIGADGWPELIDLGIEVLDPAGGKVRLPGPGATIEIAGMQLDLGFDAARDQEWRLSGTLAGVTHPAGSIGRVQVDGGGRIALDRSGADEGNAAEGRIVLQAGEIAATDPGVARAIGTALGGEISMRWRQDEPVAIPKFDLRGAGIVLGGSVTIDSKGTATAVAGTVIADVENIARFSGVAGRPLGGSGRIVYAGTFAPLTGGLEGTLNLDATDLRIGQPELDGLLAGGSRLVATLRRDESGIDLAGLTIEAPALGGVVAGRLATGYADIFGTLDLHDIGALGPGYGGSAELAVAYSLANGIEAVDVTAAGRDVAIGRSAELDGLLAGDSDLVLEATRDPDGLRIGRFDLTTPALVAVASGDVRDGASDFEASLAVADLGALGSVYGGAIDLQARIEQEGGVDRISLAGEARDVTLGAGPLDQLLGGTTTLALEARRQDGSIQLASMRVAGAQLGIEAAGTMDGEVSRVEISAQLADLGLFLPDFPGPVTLGGTVEQREVSAIVALRAKGPGGIEADLGGEILTAVGRANLSLRGTADAMLANRFVRPVSLRGPVRFDLALRGEPGIEALTGQIDIAGVRALNPDPFFAVGKIEGTVRLSAAEADIALRGRPEGGGELLMAGSIGLGGDQTANLGITLRDAVLRDPKRYSARASGTLTVRGPLRGGATLAGRLDIAEAELRLARSTAATLGAGLPELRHSGDSGAVRLTRARAGLDGNGLAEGNGRGPAYAVDLDIEAPRRVFLRGRGLDAEMGGALRLQGTSQAVLPSGGLNLIRGRLEVLGKRFDLTEGNLSLEGRFMPRLSLVAATRTTDGEARVEVGGTSAAPEIHFRSTPEQPEEDVLAQLLFGRSISNLSPVQAAQLASALAQLAGGADEGIVSRLRRETGLDDLDLVAEDDGQAAVRAGKYLSQNVYADILIGPEGRSEVTLNLDLTPALTARGRAGADGTTGLGLFFERDY
jgi:translocation and assembly module TamB